MVLRLKTKQFMITPEFRGERDILWANEHGMRKMDVGKNAKRAIMSIMGSGYKPHYTNKNLVKKILRS